MLPCMHLLVITPSSTQELAALLSFGSFQSIASCFLPLLSSSLLAKSFSLSP
jgi:hypothetical protein